MVSPILSAARSILRVSGEVGLFGAPVFLLAGFGAIEWRPVVFWLALCGWASLSLGLGGSRASGRITLVRWSRPSSTLDKATTVMAYNGVLGIGTVVGIFAWAATHWLVIGGIVATLAPLWLLKHIQFFLELEEIPEE